MSYFGFAPYVPVAVRKANAARAASKMMKKGEKVEPIVLNGKKLAVNWWGDSWNKNLERYADYENRIARGRTYVRGGMVVDLKIVNGIILALVAGSRSKPYKIEIKIKTLDAKVWDNIVKNVSGEIDSIETLLAGSFPEKLRDVFFKQETGLFPPPREISFNCSCPDWASMCKHVAASLYGVGARLDVSPALLFTLRGVNMEDLAGRVAGKVAKKILKTKNIKTDRMIKPTIGKNNSLEDIFGIKLTGTRKAVLKPVAKPAKKNSKTKKNNA
jgi:uncharacterized Zn finger protein